MPGCFQLDEIADEVEALGGFCGPIVRELCGNELGAFHGFCGSSLEEDALCEGCDGGDATDLFMGGKCG